MIEVKYLSGNDVGGDKARFARYISGDAFRNAEQLMRSGMYELARNWRIGVELAGPRPLYLINLGIEKRILKRGDELDEFRWSLALGEQRHFRFLDWHTFLDPWTDLRPAWLSEYLDLRLGPPPTIKLDKLS